MSRNDSWMLPLLLTFAVVLLGKSHSFPILSPHHGTNGNSFLPKNRFLLAAKERSNHDTNEDMRLLPAVQLWDGLVRLWEEVIEVSTYGPSERRMRKKAAAARRAEEESATAKKSQEEEEDDALSLDNFRLAMENNRLDVSSSSRSRDDDDDDAEAIVGNNNEPRKQQQQQQQDFDGYALRDLLVTKWGVPLDVDFQRVATGETVYCTIMPVAFGSRKCQHENELAYLMHLQGVVEVLDKYNNLDLFVDFIVTTSKVPKAGTDSVPFRMELSDDDVDKILGR